MGNLRRTAEPSQPGHTDHYCRGFFFARLCNPSETHRRHGRTRPAQTLNLLGVVFVVRCLQWRYRQNRRRHVAKRLVATASSSRVRNSGRGVVCSQIHPSRAASPRAGDKGLRLVRWRWGVRRLEFRAGQEGPKRQAKWRSLMIFPTRGCKPCRQWWQTASTAPFRKKRHHDAHWHPALGGALTLAPSPRLCGAHATGSQARRQPLRAAAGLVPQPSVFPDKDPPSP